MRRNILGVAMSCWLAAVCGPAWAAGSEDDASSSSDPRYAQAVKEIEARRHGEAVSILKELVAAKPDNADAWNLLGYSQRKMGRYERALISYGKALELKPRHLGANEYLGELHLQMGQVEKAKARLKVLDQACFFGCREYDQLKAAIALYESSGKHIGYRK